MNKQLIKDFGEIYFTLNWVISIFQENVIYNKSLTNRLQENKIAAIGLKRKMLYQSGAYNYAMILLAELYESSKKIRDNDIRISQLLQELAEYLKNPKIMLLREELNEFIEANKQLISRFKDRRDKADVHLTRFSSEIITNDHNGTTEFHKATLILEHELLLLVNFLIYLCNNVLLELNQYTSNKYDLIKDFDFHIFSEGI